MARQAAVKVDAERPRRHEAAAWPDDRGGRHAGPAPANRRGIPRRDHAGVGQPARAGDRAGHPLRGEDERPVQRVSPAGRLRGVQHWPRQIYDRIADADPEGAAAAMSEHILDSWLARRHEPGDGLAPAASPRLRPAGRAAASVCQFVMQGKDPQCALPGAVPPSAPSPRRRLGEHWFDLSAIIAEISPGTLSGAALAGVRDAIESGDLPGVEAPTRYAPPLAGIGKIVCIGLNYRDHAAETGAPPPPEPVLFMKAPAPWSAGRRRADSPASIKTDYEVELAVVIGGTARYLGSPGEARACIAGFAISNDVSEREFQHRAGRPVGQGQELRDLQPAGAVARHRR